MRRTTSRWIAAVSAFAFLGSLWAARRPRYGGTLRVEMSAAVQTLDPAVNSELDGLAFEALIFETLVRLDDRGLPRPWLAESWTHDTARKRWVFTPRSNVTLQSGSHWDPPGGAIAVPDDRPIERILTDLARPNNAISIRSADGAPIGTGPFAVTKWDPGKAVTLTAHGMYWGGRAYLDSIEIQMGRTSQQQALDLELGKADAIEVPVTDLRRLRQRNAHLAVSPPVEVLALVFDGPRAIAPPVEEALALSIDRAAMHTVLLQREGEVSAALLPQWLSGYSFVFRTTRDVARARVLGAGAGALTLAYQRSDALARSIAERVAVNANEAGLSLRAVPGTTGDLRLARLRIASANPETALADLATQLKTQPAASGSLYEMEKALLGNGRVIPLLHLPVAWQLSPKVHGWTGSARLEDVWLDAGSQP
jgi:peptide/nickel transport system substrate-binding protein